jgi:hypothetical protein
VLEDLPLEIDSREGTYQFAILGISLAHEEISDEAVLVSYTTTRLSQVITDSVAGAFFQELRREVQERDQAILAATIRRVIANHSSRCQVDIPGRFPCQKPQRRFFSLCGTITI